MRIIIGIAGVDGESNLELTTPSVRAANAFLNTNDHEGSAVGMVISAETAEEVYDLLTKLTEF